MSGLLKTARRKAPTYCGSFYSSSLLPFCSSSHSIRRSWRGPRAPAQSSLLTVARRYCSYSCGYGPQQPRQRTTSTSTPSLSHHQLVRPIHRHYNNSAATAGDVRAAAAWQSHDPSGAVVTIPQKRTTHAVYALGEGWTGALGTGRLDQNIVGHFDAEDLHDDPNQNEPSRRLRRDANASPVCMYEGSGAVLSCSVGWAHSALVVAPEVVPEEEELRSGSNELMIPEEQHQHNFNKLLVTGRPHEFMSVLRLRRQPNWLRQYASDLLYRTTHGADPNSNHPIDLIGRTLQFLSEVFLKDNKLDWEKMRQHSFLTSPTEIAIPAKIYRRNQLQLQQRQLHPGYNYQHALVNPDHNNPVEMRIAQPLSVSCGAGLTAVTCADGRVYTFGLNGMGQCGIGRDSNNVWTPTAVTGLSSQVTGDDRTTLRQSHPIQTTALGLQHGLCLNTAGEIFSWGKGDRGQLGHERGENESHTAQPIQRILVDVAAKDTGKPVYDHLGPVAQIAAGMIHSAALELDTNRVFLWGKNLLPLPPNGKGTRNRKVATDARLPFVLRGLPQRQVLQIACGSHHTAFLLEDGSVWAVGLATDTVKPLHTPFCLIEPGVIDLPVRQFVAHMDRTTVVTASGEVLQAHLWEEPENRAYAVFTPAWVDDLLANTCEPGTRIRQVHRSWLHTLVVTERDVD